MHASWDWIKREHSCQGYTQRPNWKLGVQIGIGEASFTGPDTTTIMLEGWLLSSAPWPAWHGVVSHALLTAPPPSTNSPTNHLNPSPIHQLSYSPPQSSSSHTNWPAVCAVSPAMRWFRGSFLPRFLQGGHCLHIIMYCQLLCYALAQARWSYPGNKKVDPGIWSKCGGIIPCTQLQVQQ